MKTRYYENTVVIELEGEVAFFNAQEIKKGIYDVIRPNDQTVVLQLSKVEFIDSAGLGIFISLVKWLNQKEGHLILEHPQLGVQRFLEMTRLDELMEVRKSQEPTTGSWPVATK